MRALTIGDRTFLLRFDMLTIEEMEKEVDREQGKTFLDFAQENFRDFRQVHHALPVIFRANNQNTPDEKWFKSALKNVEIGSIINLSKIIMEEFTKAMTMETDEKNDAPVDLVLDEIRKKDKADG